MWSKLWNDFVARTRTLATLGAQDGIDQAIQYQLDGLAPFAQAPLAPDDLHLPEICSGAPWRLSDVPQLSGRWVAFVGPNPAHDPASFYPSIALRAQTGDAAIISFFEHRFEPVVVQDPIIHGTSPRIGSPTVWMQTPNGPPRPRSQATWREINKWLHGLLAAAGLQSQSPLGRLAAMVDMAPWKFNNWASADPGLQIELLTAGLPYLHWVIDEFSPSAVVLLGVDAWHAFATVVPGIPAYHLAGKPVRQGVLATKNGPIPVFGIPHTNARHGAFGVAFQVLIPLLRTALQI